MGRKRPGPRRRYDAHVSEPAVTVVIVSWNTREHLVACLRSVAVAGQALPIETIVVDNGSADGSAEAAAATGVQVIRNAENRGFAAAVNQGLSVARGRHALLLNPDARLPERAIADLAAYLDATPDVGIVGAALRDPDGRRQQSVAEIPSLATELLNRALLRRFHPDREAGEAPRDVPSVIGACLMARRTAIDAVGPLDEGYFVFLEETDWCVRMREKGFRVVHHPGVVVAHAQGAAKAHAPAAGWIEYTRSLYRFFRLRRSRGAYLALRVLRPLKTALNLAGNVLTLAVTLGLHARSRRKVRINTALLWWHLRGCPDSMGLRGVRP